MKRIVWDGVLADLSRIDSVRVGGYSPCGNEKWIEPIVLTDVPQGHRVRLSITLEPIDTQPREERELERARAALRARMAQPVNAFNPAALAAAAHDATACIESLISARVARALRVHCDADHDDDL